GEGGAGGGGGGGGGGEEESSGRKNRLEALLVLAEAGRSLESLPKDLAAAIEAGRIPGSIVQRFFELEKSPVFRWLLQFGGFKERLLADDLFLTKVAIECGVGIFTKVLSSSIPSSLRMNVKVVHHWVVLPLMRKTSNYTSPSYSGILCVIMLVHTAILLGRERKGGRRKREMDLSFSLLGQVHLWYVILIGTGITNALINVRKAIDKDFGVEAEDVPILSTSVAYGVYMAVSSNLRYK
ncbi:hypothetical protein B296_00027465, partial [Ensete ventricosum]